MAIFVNYRREDSQSVTGRIDDHLRAAFGEAEVYRDIDSIQIGVDFARHIQAALEHCDVGVAVIGPHWLSPRLNDKDDWVRLELEAMFKREIPLVPLLVEGAELPSKESLPPSLQPLLRRQALRVDSGADFRPQVRRLINALRTLRRGRRGQSSLRVLVAAGAVTACVALGVAVARVWRAPRHDAASASAASGSGVEPVPSPIAPRVNVTCDGLPPPGSVVFDPPALGAVVATELCAPAPTGDGSGTRWEKLASATGARLEPPNPFYSTALAKRDGVMDITVRLSSPKPARLKLIPPCDGIRFVAVALAQDQGVRASGVVGADCSVTLYLPVEAWGKTLALTWDPDIAQPETLVFDALTKDIVARRREVIGKRPAATTASSAVAKDETPCTRQCEQIRSCRRQRAAEKQCTGLSGDLFGRCITCAEVSPACQSSCP